MGCYSYEVNGTTVRMSFELDGYPCLCTLEGNAPLDAERVRSLAALGAVVALVGNGRLAEGYEYAPTSLPERIRAGIEYFVPTERTGDAG